MKQILISMLAGLAFYANAGNISGAGASFPYPVYAKWAEEYNTDTGIQVNYQSIGSSGGIKQIDKKTVDFGATDSPRKAEDVAANGQFQFPAVIGGVVPVVNIPGVGVGDLTLTGSQLADIFEGKITNWQQIDTKLPDLPITLAVRADGSGTTAVFTDYLAIVSASFAQNVGVGKSVKWGGSTVGGKGNAGVAAMVGKIKGAIGYVEYAYAKQGGLAYTALVDKTGVRRLPDATGFEQAAASADWTTPGMAVNLNNQEGWPITAATFILVYKEGNVNTTSVLKFFDWAFTNGNNSAAELDYVPLPKIVQDRIRAAWTANIK